MATGKLSDKCNSACSERQDDRLPAHYTHWRATLCDPSFGPSSKQLTNV